jgi:hypothetical protein
LDGSVGPVCRPVPALRGLNHFVPLPNSRTGELAARFDIVLGVTAQDQ